MRAQVSIAFLVLMSLATSARASVEINAGPTKNINCASGVCSPTAKNAVLNTTDLANMLATGDVKVVTGNGAVTITVSSALTWTSGSRLTLDASYNVSFRAAVEVAGQGGLTLITNDGGTGGDVVFLDGGVVDFWDATSSLVINSQAYTLVSTLPDLIDAIAENPFGDFALSKNYRSSKTHVFKASPIKAFAGNFEGLGHTISNLAINRPKHKGNKKAGGMFAISNGTVRDIGLRNEISSGYYYSGGLVGENYGKIVGSYVSGSLDGEYVGGLAAINYGYILRSYASTQVAAISSGGGLVAWNVGGSITQCFSNGAIENAAFMPGNYWGGLVAANVNANQTIGTITQSYSAGSIDVDGVAGGLVGDNEGSITLSHSEDNISNASSGSGGLVATNIGTISESYANGSVAPSDSGGFVGINGGNGAIIDESYATGSAALGGFGYTNYATISQSYFTGRVDQRADGGFVGIDKSSPGSLSSTYWDTDTSGVWDLSNGAGNILNDPGITGLSSAQLSRRLPTGFDHRVWAESPTINNGYPYLIANPPPK